ncbi:GNAT family N-acetyltransferase [Scopulibacillus cellulosilyticus]|uniref:GNAT family N-acetyltransferase n=1 Tax=Scopulibacillus cellulosilyticus TaxID=2665665 RepID=A0ABW2Q1D1_9BACL
MYYRLIIPLYFSNFHDLEDGEQAFISYIDDEPAGMVRFRLNENSVYFYRLSVIPENQGQGIAKKLLKSLEDYLRQKEKASIQCKVRLTVSKNINLYSSMGYSIYDEEIVHKPNGINIKVVSMQKQLINKKYKPRNNTIEGGG